MCLKLAPCFYHSDGKCAVPTDVRAGERPKIESLNLSDGRRQFTHERLRRARSSLSRLVSRGTLFTYLDPALTAEGPLPRTNNAIEGGPTRGSGTCPGTIAACRPCGA